MSRPAKICAALGVLLVFCMAPVSAEADFGIQPGSLHVEALNQDGTPDFQAGTHPYEFVVHFSLNTESSGDSEGGEMRDAIGLLPPGLVGNPSAIPSCPAQDLVSLVPTCPGDTQIGVLKATVSGGISASTAIYNLTPPPGVPARIGFNLFGANTLQDASVLTSQGYRLEVGAFNIPVDINEATEIIWGVPPAAGHDAERECVKPSGHGTFLGCSSDISPGTFLTLPDSCSTPPELTLRVDSKLAPGVFDEQSAVLRDGGGNAASLTNCDAVPFSPEVAAQPTSNQASSAAGLGFKLALPNEGLLNPSGIAETQPVKTEVVLPQGVTVNPSAASGLAACSQEAFIHANGEPGVGCPEASKLGTLVAKTPLINESIEGSVYLAAQHANPFGTLAALYIVASSPERGILVKQAGRVDINEATGQLTTTFDGLPPLPYSSFELNLREGPRAPLTMPLGCGEYQTVARLYPFSSPGAATVRTAPFTVSSGPEGGGCVGSEAQLPNGPSFEAGTETPLAGLFSPFVLKVTRGEASQQFKALNIALPVGLLGSLVGTTECSNAQIAAAESRSREGEGAIEQANPSCPASSELGTVTVGAGSGTPLYVQGKAYLAGPYKGAPLSMVNIVPAIAGPFDLGTVVVRTALYVNESTSQITVKTDPLPTSLQGIPLDVRSISVAIAKKNFTLNPTNCEASAVHAEVSSPAGSVAQVQNRFQVGGCNGLEFKPSLKLYFSGQMKRTGNPAVKAVLTQPAGENANLSGATVILPKGMLIDNSHISNPCTRVQFNSKPVPGEGCPATSILGTAKVWTPLLEEPEEGKVYFRSNGGERQLPDLAVALRGRVPLQLLGFIDSVGKKGAEVRRVRSRFLNVPDAPVSRFELKLAGGKKGLLENSKNLCKSSDRAKFQLAGQNGKTENTEPLVQVSCGKQSQKKSE